MTFDEASEYMESLNKRGIKPGLEGIRSLLDALGAPDFNLKFIQVAGTNGKGSTSQFVSKILQAQGYKVGVYSSPSVFNPLEIIKVNGRNISKADYARLTDIIFKANTMGCTRFEVETALAMLLFSEKECDYVVLEAGMGGLLDATNVVSTTIASVISSIGMDHMQFLGDTIDKIAFNKAGIVKSASLCITTLQDETAMKVIKKACDDKKTSLYISDYSLAKNVKFRIGETIFDYKNFKKLSIRLMGVYQIKNAALAVDTALALRESGIDISDSSIRKGLKEATVEGRFEMISNKPIFVIDGAHNEPAAIVLKESLQTYFTKRRFVYIMGMFKDKASETVIKLMAKDADAVITVTLPNKERSLTAYELAKAIEEYNPMVTTADSIYEAVEMAMLMADANTVIVGFGSLSHLNDIKKAVKTINEGSKHRGLKI